MRSHHAEEKDATRAVGKHDSADDLQKIKRFHPLNLGLCGEQIKPAQTKRHKPSFRVAFFIGNANAKRQN